MAKESLNEQIDSKFNQALKTFQNGESERAEDLCSEILKDHPDHGNTLNLMGVIYLKQGALEKACELIQQAIQHHAQKAPIFSYNLALAYSLLGNVTAAVNVYKKAAEIFQERGEKEEVLNCLESAANLLRGHNYLNEAKNFYQSILEINPLNITVRNDIGVILLQENKLDEAMHCFKEVIQLDHSYSEAYNNLGLIFLIQRKFDEAIVHLEKSLELDPLSVEAHINLGNVYLEEGRLEKSMHHCKKALDLDPEHPGAYNNLGIIFHHQGHIEEAIVQFKKALEINPLYEDAQKHLDSVMREVESL